MTSSGTVFISVREYGSIEMKGLGHTYTHAYTHVHVQTHQSVLFSFSWHSYSLKDIYQVLLNIICVKCISIVKVSIYIYIYIYIYIHVYYFFDCVTK